jgi:hypothetical protein
MKKVMLELTMDVEVLVPDEDFEEDRLMASIGLIDEEALMDKMSSENIENVFHIRIEHVEDLPDDDPVDITENEEA